MTTQESSESQDALPDSPYDINLPIPSYNVTVRIPSNLRWDQITKGISLRGIEQQFHFDIRSHFAFLLRQAGWLYGVDWQPAENIVVVTVPNNLYMTREVTADGIYIDGISVILYKTLAQVDITTVSRHFVQQ